MPKSAPMPAEQRAKIAAAMRGRPKTKKHRRAIGRGVMLANERKRDADR